jgi:hypothetical protein
VHRHGLMPAARAGLLAAPVAAMLAAGLVSPAGAAPGHPVSAVRSTDGTRGSARIGPYVLAGPEPRAWAASPGVPEHTLTVKATNLAGKPDTGGVLQLFNVDNRRLSPQGQRFEHGVATLRVAAGHYFGVASFGGPKNTRNPLRIVVLPQVTVTGNTTVSVHEAAADSKLTMVTPRPATVLDTDMWFKLTGASGQPTTLEAYFTSSQQLWISPTHVKPAVGTMRFSVNQHLESPPGPGIPYEYTLSYTGPPGIIPPQRHVVPASDLATIHERFYQPVTSTGDWAFNGSFPGTNANKDSWFGFIEPAGKAVKLPGRLTEYAGGTGSALMEWGGQYGPFRGVQNVGGDTRLLRPGEHLTDNWSAYPLHPGVNALLTTLPNMFWMFGDIIPSAVRTGNTLQLEVDPFDDNQPGHEIGLVQPAGLAQATGTYQIDQNGKKIASGDAVAAAKFGNFYTTATLSPKPSTVRFSLNYTRTSTDFPLSTATSTVWTFRSAPVTTAARLSPGWSCVRYAYQPKGCAAQPMMTLDYAVAHLRLDGTAPAGPQTVHLTVGHLQAVKAAGVTTVAVSVSFDGGKTWHRATVTGGNGSYTAAFTAPAGAKVSLRTRAADAAGGSVAETITSAYQIGS